jgi:hypothetical protein
VPVEAAYLARGLPVAAVPARTQPPARRLVIARETVGGWWRAAAGRPRLGTSSGVRGRCAGGGGPEVLLRRARSGAVGLWGHQRLLAPPGLGHAQLLAYGGPRKVREQPAAAKRQQAGEMHPSATCTQFRRPWLHLTNALEHFNLHDLHDSQPHGLTSSAVWSGQL